MASLNTLWYLYIATVEEMEEEVEGGVEEEDVEEENLEGGVEEEDVEEEEEEEEDGMEWEGVEGEREEEERKWTMQKAHS